MITDNYYKFKMFIQIIPICDESVNITPQNVLDSEILKETNTNVKILNFTQ